MTSRTAQFVRTYESVAADTPLADRWDDLIAQSEALEQRMADVLEAHRADCRARYGRDFAGEE